MHNIVPESSRWLVIYPELRRLVSLMFVAVPAVHAASHEGGVQKPLMYCHASFLDQRAEGPLTSRQIASGGPAKFPAQMHTVGKEGKLRELHKVMHSK